jgi:hypothetical protein
VSGSELEQLLGQGSDQWWAEGLLLVLGRDDSKGTLDPAGTYRRRPDGSWQYDGPRPGSGWHGHGYCTKGLTTLQASKPVEVPLHKHRWLLKGTNTTQHSRPPDDARLVHFCTLIIVLRLWACLSGAVGFHHRREMLPDLGSCGSDRTVQRWLHQALEQASETKKAIELALEEKGKSEPRPKERLFRGGLSPPDSLVCRQWQNPPAVKALWQALAMLLVGAKKLGADVTILLAEARRRFSGPKDSFII